MWRNPKYAGPATDHPTPPDDAAQRLATFPRQNGSELRVSLAEYQGHEFVSLRLWEPGLGGLWPSKKGVTVKLREVDELVRALAAIAGSQNDVQGVPIDPREGNVGRGPEVSASSPRGPRSGRAMPLSDRGAKPSDRPDWREADIQPPNAVGSGDEFNEFADDEDF